MDIREFNEKTDLPQELYNLDILDGSPPCSTFSMAGQREDAWGVEKVFREGQKKQTLDDLMFVFIETVNKLQPKVVVMENVEGLMKGNAWKYVQGVYARFNKIGYKVHHWLLKGEKRSAFQTKYIRDHEIMPTQRSKPDIIDLKELAYVSKETVRNSQTFPSDFDFSPNTYSNIGYICGMSVPPIMMKRVVERIITSGIFNQTK